MSKKKSALFTKPDEMEIALSYRAMRITWIVVNITFVGLAIVFFVNGGVNPISLVLILAAEVVYFVVKTFLKWRITRGGADKE